MKVSVGGRFAALLSDSSLEDASETSTDKTSTDVELCSICRKLFYSDDSSTRTHRVIDVIRSAKTGCGFCKVLRSALDVDYNRSSLAAARTVGTVQYEARPSIFNLLDRLLIEWGSPRRDFYLVCEILTVPTSEVPDLAEFPLNFQGPQPQSKELHLAHTSSQDSLGLVQAWLQYCDSQHPLCRLMHTAARKLPTRLLEIDRSSIRLRKGSDLPVEALYIALSHCWGTSTMSKLCRGSSLLEGKGMLKSELSMTFQHAISVTEILGHSYLWIDSLCIIQDSDQDRQQECSRMWEVYGNSYCTIAATASSDGSEGLFRQHDAGGPVPCKITPVWKDLASHYTDNADAGYHFLHDHDLITNIEESPLCRRAWVVQERLLSPRNVHFASNKIWWECRELCASETYPQGIPALLDGSVKQKWDPLSVSHAGSLEDCYKAWNWCVERYSRSGLSQPQDKLVALAGVARQFSQAFQRCGQPDTYLAGLWKNRLPLELLWRYTYRSAKRKRSATYRAPSWSWASVNNEIFFLEAGKPGDFCYAELISHNVSTSVDPFGATSAGIIRLRGPLMRVELTLKEDPRSSSFPKKDSFRIMASPSSEFECGIYLDDLRMSKLGKSMEVYALAICRSAHNSSKGLILQPTTMQTLIAGQLHGSFVRVGTFGMDADNYQRFMDVSNLNKDPALVYDEDNGDGHYTINIV